MEHRKETDMVYELSDTSKAAPLFDGWQETLIYSCLQKVMGRVYVTDPEQPSSAVAFIGCQKRQKSLKKWLTAWS